jgi:hypothetical protein
MNELVYGVTVMAHPRTEVFQDDAVIAAQEVALRRNTRKKQIRAAGWIGLAITPGAGIGMALGIHNMNGDAENYAKAESHLLQAQEQLKKDRGEFRDYIGALPVACQTSVKAYLAGGPNRKFSTQAAQLSLQESQTCPADGVTIVSDARELRKTVRQDRRAVNHAERSATEARKDMQTNGELYESAITGVFVEVVAIGASMVGYTMITDEIY